MEYGLTVAVQKRIKTEKNFAPGKETDYRFCWEVNIIKMQNKNVLLIVHASSRYCIVCANMKPSFWENFESSLRDAIVDAMLRESFTLQEAEEYFQKAGEAKLTKTHGKKVMGGVNRIAVELPYYCDSLEDGLFQRRLADMMNDQPITTAAHPEYTCIFPKDYFRNEMKNLLYGEEMKLKFAMVKGGVIRNGVLEKR